MQTGSACKQGVHACKQGVHASREYTTSVLTVLVVHECDFTYYFVVFVYSNGVVVGVASLNHDPIVSQAAELFRAGDVISESDIMYVYFMVL